MRCKAGDDISLPFSIDPETGGRSLDIRRLTVSCDPDHPVLPTPTYTWTKDGIVVLRTDQHGNSIQMIDEDFIMQGNNSLLLFIEPPPLRIVSFILVMDFTATGFIMSNMTAMNITLPDGGTSSEDIRRFIIDTLAGDWKCTVRNAFGSNCRNTTVLGKLLP